MVKIMENPIKIDDLGVSLFLETPIYIYTIYGGILQAASLLTLGSLDLKGNVEVLLVQI